MKTNKEKEADNGEKIFKDFNNFIQVSQVPNLPVLTGKIVRND